MAIEAAQVVLDANTISTIINNINSLYNNLIAYTVGLLLFVGAVIPSVISFFQNKQFRKEQDDIKNKIGLVVTNTVLETEERLKALLEKTLEEALAEALNKMQVDIDHLKQKLEKEIAGTKASTYHLQANQQGSTPTLALVSCEYALALYIQAQQENNVRKILDIFHDNLKKINKNMFDGYIEVESTIEGIIKTLEENNENSKYAVDIQKIKFGLKDAKNREPKA